MTLQVAVETILVSSSSFFIFSGPASDGGRAIVRSKEPIVPAIGEVYEVQGQEAEYRDQRGNEHRQIEAEYITRVRVSGKLLGPWLQTLPGIGQERAERLLKAYGSDILAVLSDQCRTEEIASVISPARPHLGQKLVALIQARLVGMMVTENAAVEEGQFYLNLEEYGITQVSLARRLWRLFAGADGWAGLCANPYALASVADWKTADHFGKRLLVVRTGSLDVENHPARLLGACASIWRGILSRGDTACSREGFLAGLAKRVPTPSAALTLALDRQIIQESSHYLHPKGIAYMEREMLAGLQRLRACAAPVDGIDRLIENAQKSADLLLTEEQRAGLRVILSNPVCCLQGGAGTGKTTLLRVLVHAWEQQGGDVIIAAIAGKAALRASRASGKLAYTVSRLVHGIERKLALAAEGQYDAAESISVPLISSRSMIILDESSMCDLQSLRKLIDHAPDGARLAFVGDFAQLPPVGLGQVYHDLVSSGWETAILSKPLRQAEANPIVRVANDIRTGIAPDLPSYKALKNGVFHLDCATKDVARNVHALKRDLEQRGDLLVLTALRATAKEINDRAALALEVSGVEGRRLGPLCPYTAVGEPVVMSRNHYAHGIMNGQTGVVRAIAPSLKIKWDGDDEAKEAHDDYIADIEPAHAITCHRSQGSEADIIIVALDSERLIARNWLYTAVTRARKTVILVGPALTIENAVATVTNRKTGLRWMLERKPARS